MLRTGVREHHAPRVGPPGPRGWLLKAFFSISKELGRFGSFGAEPCKFFGFLDFLNFPLNPPAREKVPILDGKLIYQISVENIIQKVLRTGVREHLSTHGDPPEPRGWLLGAFFSILTELGRFGDISEASGTASLAVCLFFSISLIFHSIYLPEKKSPILFV